MPIGSANARFYGYVWGYVLRAKGIVQTVERGPTGFKRSGHGVQGAYVVLLEIDQDMDKTNGHISCFNGR